MAVVGVDAAVAEQAHQVQGRPVFHAVVHGGTQRLVLEEIAVCDGLGDAGQFLIHHAACADVGVSHFGVSHLPVGQAHIHAGRTNGGVGAGVQQPINNGGVCRINGIAIFIPVNAEAIQNNQC